MLKIKILRCFLVSRYVKVRKVLEFFIFPDFLTLRIAPIEPFAQHETSTNVKYQYCTRNGKTVNFQCVLSERCTISYNCTYSGCLVSRAA